MSIVPIADLSPSEAAFIATMQDLGFGQIEHVQIRAGEIVLAPLPVVIRQIKFGSRVVTGKTVNQALEPRQQITEFLSYVRGIADGEIRTLEVRHGLPFAMEIKLAGGKVSRGSSNSG